MKIDSMECAQISYSKLLLYTASTHCFLACDELTKLVLIPRGLAHTLVLIESLWLL